MIPAGGAAPRSRPGRQFLRFAAVGVVGMFADMAALAFALEILHLDVYGGRVFSYLIAATTTWVSSTAATPLELPAKHPCFVNGSGFWGPMPWAGLSTTPSTPPS